ncbi:hypothetical protein [Candidatus Clostridium stratigraminis]|uniref:Uncharacterized protein n=1 Tax=Candidatus Clostridium stratigraminis TaxID=3381661 RepID=A0ABW8T1A0_9CLOT
MEELKISIDDRCPYCSSDNINPSGNSHKVKGYPEYESFVCKKCGQEFRILKNK